MTADVPEVPGLGLACVNTRKLQARPPSHSLVCKAGGFLPFGLVASPWCAELWQIAWVAIRLEGGSTREHRRIKLSENCSGNIDGKFR